MIQRKSKQRHFANFAKMSWCMCLSVVAACEQAPGKDGKEIRRARKRRNSEAIGGKKFGERDTEESGRMSEAVGGNAKISAVRSLADICFLHVLIRLIRCIIVSVCPLVF